MVRWLRLLLSLIAVVGFMFTFPLLLKKFDAYEQLIQNSEELEIDNSSLFYSEEMWTSRAESQLKIQLGEQSE